ncbi:hypothetical protein QTP88_009836 [Uroleucon formosanum]
MLDGLPLDIRANSIFQQDGAPAHNANIVRNYLNEYFPNRWIGTYGAVQWPPRSPDLIPLDYFLRGPLKTVVYINPPTCLEKQNSYCIMSEVENFLKKVGELHLLSKYNNDENVCVAIKTIIVLAFIPLYDLNIAADELADELPDELIPLFEWFEEFYIGKKNRRVGRRKPRNPLEMWNLHQRILNDTDRTNNHAEAANRRLNIQMGTHPTI